MAAERPEARRGSAERAAPARAGRATDAEARDAAVVRDLGAWYDEVARDLPWRRTRDPYAVWLSEIMLQQTRVETVVPYFERFLARFPDVGSLAAAPLDDVLGLWSGLGYYRRARQLHAAAREVTERWGGALPASAAELRTLSGVGAYTAGAVASIAFDRREPLVDGNVARVLARLEGIDDDVRGAEGARRLWEAAARLVPEDRPGRFNQALMELGATVCSPRAPRCEACPVRARCVAAEEGRQDALPVVSPKRAPRAVRVVAAVIRHGGRVWLARRVESGLFGGLWEPPMVEARSIAAARAALAGAGIAADVRVRRAGEVKHVLSHRALQVLVVAGSVERAWRDRRLDAAAYERAAWLAPDAALGVSTLARKVLAAAR